jgi:hypothetical protein
LTTFSTECWAKNIVPVFVIVFLVQFLTFDSETPVKKASQVHTVVI